MPLPKSVVAQAAEADRMVRVINGTAQPGDETAGVDPATLPPALNDVAPPGQPAKQARQRVPAPQPPAPPPATPPAHHAQPPATPPAQPGETWEQRYHVLQGKYNAEVPALQTQLTNAMAAMGNMGRELDNLKTQVAQRPAAPPQQPTAPPPSFSPQDEQTWGADMLDMVRRGAAQEAQRLMEPVVAENTRLRAELATLKGTTDRVVQTQQQTREEVFYQRLAELIGSDWQQQNNDPGFLQWLAVMEPMLGKSRQELIKQAAEALDAQRVAVFFNSYRATLPPPAATPPQTELGRQVTPTGTRAAAQPVATGSAGTIEIWSPDEINQFYTDVSRGRYRNNPQEQERLNKAITQAVAEGRVR